MQAKDKKLIIFSILLIVFSIGLLIFSVVQFNNTNIDNFPEFELAEDIDINSQALIVDGDELLREIGSVEAMNQLSNDLYVFGVDSFTAYLNGETDLVGFRVTSAKTEEGVVVAEGKYGSSNNNILFSVVPLNYGRITVSITNEETGKNIDDQLPSNTPKNQYIGQLPVTRDGFVIDYVEGSDFFTVNLIGDGSAVAARNEIRSALGDEYAEEDVFIYGGGSRSINNNF